MSFYICHCGNKWKGEHFDFGNHIDQREYISANIEKEIREISAENR